MAAMNTSLESEKKRNQALEDRLQRLIAEFSEIQGKFERQRQDIQRAHQMPTADKIALNDQDYKLRETMSELAAEMVAKTAADEGKHSPIHTILSQTAQSQPDEQTARSQSLAERIKKMMV